MESKETQSHVENKVTGVVQQIHDLGDVFFLQRLVSNDGMASCKLDTEIKNTSFVAKAKLPFWLILITSASRLLPVA